MTGATTERAAEDAALSVYRERCAGWERALRLQYPGGELSPAAERELAGLPVDTLEQTIGRLVALRVLYREHFSARTRAADPVDAQTAALQLLLRSPVAVQLASGRRVNVTGRSLAALVEIASHEASLALLQVEQEEVRALLVKVLARRQGKPLRRRWRFRRFARRVSDAYVEVCTQIHRHRERLYANLFTESGARATLEDHAPDWWVELSPVDDLRLLSALHEAGPARLARIPVPKTTRAGARGGGGGGTGGDELGFARLLGAYGVRMKVEPARLVDQDAGQVLAGLLSLPVPTLDDEVEG